jgi:hypothetical protein
MMEQDIATTREGSIYNASCQDPITPRSHLSILPVPTKPNTNHTRTELVPYIELNRLSALDRAKYQHVDPSIIDSLAKAGQRSISISYGGVSIQSSRRQLASPPFHNNDDASDEADNSNSDSDDGAVHAPRRYNSHATSFGNPSGFQKAPRNHPKRRATVEIVDWDDETSWGTKNLPQSLVDLIKHCGETKHARPDIESCPVLGLFELTWIAALGSIACLKHNRIIPGNDILNHLKAHPGSYPGSVRRNVFMAAIFHVVNCHPTIKRQSTMTIKCALPAQLPEPLPFCRNTIKQRFKCPIGGCDAWAPINSSKGRDTADIIRHLKVHTNASINSESLLPKWTQLVEIGTGRHTKGGAIHYFTFPATFNPFLEGSPASMPSFMTVDQAAPSTDIWAAEIGWEEYLDRLSLKSGSRSKIVTKLLDLVSLPSKARVSACTGPTKLLEQGLLASNKLNLAYLQDGVTWVSLMHPTIRARFAHSVYVLRFF